MRNALEISKDAQRVMTNVEKYIFDRDSSESTKLAVCYAGVTMLAKLFNEYTELQGENNNAKSE